MIPKKTTVMKQIVLQENFQQALSYLQKAIPSRPSLPILTSVLIEVDEKKCTVSATDLYFGVRAVVPSKIEEPGTVTIPGKQLREIIQSLPAGSLTLSQKETQLSIKSTSSTSSLPSQTAEEYPPFPQVEGEEFILDKSVLDQIKTHVIKSASLDPTRPILTGVLLQFSGNEVTIVGTDGFRLSVLTLPQASESESTLLIPAKVLEEVQRIAESLQVSQIKFTVSQELKQVFFSFDEVEIFARLLDGEYPPYQKIIPESFLTEIKLPTDDFQEQIKRALIFSRESSIIQLHYSAEEFRITASSPGSGEFEGSITGAEVSGEEGSIAFNAKYLLDYIQSLKADSFKMSLKGNQKAAVFTSESQPGFLYLVMPFRINQ